MYEYRKCSGMGGVSGTGHVSAFKGYMFLIFHHVPTTLTK